MVLTYRVGRHTGVGVLGSLTYRVGRHTGVGVLGRLTYRVGRHTGVGGLIYALGVESKRTCKKKNSTG